VVGQFLFFFFLFFSVALGVELRTSHLWAGALQLKPLHQPPWASFNAKRQQK
jgi:hypothetical protein